MRSLPTPQSRVDGALAREPHNAPLHVFSASPELVDFARGAYRRRSAETSLLLRQLLERFEGDLAMVYTMEDFKRDCFKRYVRQLTPEDVQSVLAELPLEQRLAGLSEEQIRQYLDQRTPRRPS